MIDDRSSGRAFDESASRPVTDPHSYSRIIEPIIGMIAFSSTCMRTLELRAPTSPSSELFAPAKLLKTINVKSGGLLTESRWSGGNIQTYSNNVPRRARRAKVTNSISLFPCALEYEAHLANGIALDKMNGNPWADLIRSDQLTTEDFV